MEQLIRKHTRGVAMLGLMPSGVWVLNPTDTNQDYSVLWLNIFVRAREDKKTSLQLFSTWSKITT